MFTAQKIPTKTIFETINLDVKCSVKYIDFEGRSDGASMLKVVQQLNPREVILIGGDSRSTLQFAQNIRLTHDSIQSIFTPAVNEVVDTTKESRIYQVRI